MSQETIAMAVVDSARQHQPEWATLAAVNATLVHIETLRKELEDKTRALAALTDEVNELKGDLARFARLTAEQFGEPFVSRALEILKKHQGK